MKTHGLYLNGEWRVSGEPVTVINPATAEPVARVSTVGRDAVQQALADAHAALPGWRGLPARDRADRLLAAAAEMQRRSDEIARTMTIENGKPLAQSKGEVAMSVDHLRWFA